MPTRSDSEKKGLFRSFMAIETMNRKQLYKRDYWVFHHDNEIAHLVFSCDTELSLVT